MLRFAQIRLCRCPRNLPLTFNRRFVYQWVKQRILKKEAAEEEALRSVFHKFHKADKCDAKQWELIHVERSGGFLAGLTGLMYFFGALYGLWFVRAFYIERPGVMSVLVGFERMNWWPDKFLAYCSVFLFYWFNSIRRRFIVRMYKNKIQPHTYRLVSYTWNIRPNVTDFSTAAKNSSGLAVAPPVNFLSGRFLLKYIWGNFTAVHKRWIINEQGFNSQHFYWNLLKETMR